MKRLIVIVVFAIVAVLLLGGLLWLKRKGRAHYSLNREQAGLKQEEVGKDELKQENPVEYFIIHAPMTQTDDDQLRNALVGNWKLVGAKSVTTSNFVVLDPNNLFFKTFTLTNWATVNYDSSSNVINSAGGPYTLDGEVCTETIETATGAKKQFLGAHVPFRIRVIGDDYYQMGAGSRPSIEQQWHRIGIIHAP